MSDYFLIDEVVECFWSWRNLSILRKIEIFHIVRAISILSDISFSCWSKCLNCVLLSFLHFLVCVSFYARNCLACMDFIWINRMSIQILHYFHRIGSSSNLNLIRLHSLLDSRTDFSQSSVNTCFSNTSVGCIFDCSQQVVVGRVEPFQLQFSVLVSFAIWLSDWGCSLKMIKPITKSAATAKANL